MVKCLANKHGSPLHKPTIYCAVVTPDEHYVVGVGYDAATNKEHLRVYHLRKGVFLHKIPLKYPNFKEIKVYIYYLTI